ncbi:hypothetical protein [Roseomonas populi]|uniref:Uncharacterized protein n=1 Tax=Roseomonas populi TaxID=3121582 RepID=A0ABT1WYV2_9PROT|nr:hypothetical protein [Roseomonas pecuniae]MCR0980634.1 hypothetical protein [Roseomonas pecuniae]
MDIKKLLGMRPKEQTAAAIRAAITNAEQGKAAALARAAELEGGRGKLLLTGDAKEVEASERELTEARMEAERCDVMAQALQAPLAEAVLREKAAEFADLERQAAQQVEGFVTWWRSRYGELASEIRDGARMEKAANDSINRLYHLSNQHPEAFAASGVTIPKAPNEHLRPGYSGNNVAGMSDMIRLPPVSGRPGMTSEEDPMLWPERSV